MITFTNLLLMLCRFDSSGKNFFVLPATPGIIHAFDNLAPHRPVAGVCAGDADWLYGVLTFNGTNNSGGLYKVKRDGTGFTLLHNFTGNSIVIPYYHTDGFIYFTDAYVIKKLNPADNSVTDVGNGGFVKSLHIDANNWIYFTDFFSIQKLKTDGTGLATLHTFNIATDGNSGYAGLTETPGDSLFGVNTGGGNFSGGTLYSIKKDGTGFTVHHHFTSATGLYPESKLVYFDGKLYGTTTQGNNSVGVLYTIKPDGTGYRVLHHFDPGTPAIGQPYGNISIAANGRIFGSFYQHYYSGSIPYKLFKIDTSGTNFEPFLNLAINNQRDYGHLNKDILLTDNDENVFLATQEMGRHDGGVLSKFDTLGNAFTGQYHFGYSANGFRPKDGVIRGSDGKLYGIAKIGGTDGAGVIYSMNVDGTSYIKLHEFTDAEGYNPEGKLLEASDGKLYGISTISSTANGTIYRMNKNGTGFQVIYSFTNVADGYNPVGGLKEDNNGILYGVAYYSTPGAGVVYKVNKDGTGYSVLKTFDAGSGLNYPSGGITISGDYLYGACNYGGAEFKGGVYRIKKDGTGYEELHVFSGASDGSYAASVPIVASNGKLYGTTMQGGTNFQGIIYCMDITGTNYTILRHFSDVADGASPTGLIQGSDGLLYGATQYCNISGDFGGTVYQMNLDGSSFTMLHSFDVDSEGQVAGTLVDLNGNFIPLPVQFLTFVAQKREQSVLLSWETATEQNSDYFEVERSADGRTFTAIGKVKASGNSNHNVGYSFNDLHPMKGINFYRLKEVDLDGTFSYSKLVSVKFENSGMVILAPNPVAGQLIIKLQQGNSFASVAIFDASGKLVISQKISTGNVHLNVHHLSKGWYMLRLNKKDGSSEQYSFIKK